MNTAEQGERPTRAKKAPARYNHPPPLKSDSGGGDSIASTPPAPQDPPPPCRAVMMISTYRVRVDDDDREDDVAGVRDDVRDDVDRRRRPMRGATICAVDGDGGGGGVGIEGDNGAWRRGNATAACLSFAVIRRGVVAAVSTEPSSRIGRI